MHVRVCARANRPDIIARKTDTYPRTKGDCCGIRRPTEIGVRAGAKPLDQYTRRGWVVTPGPDIRNHYEYGRVGTPVAQLFGRGKTMGYLLRA